MPPPAVTDFLARWSHASASERANSQLFLAELCDLLEVPRPDNHPDAGYAFEFPVTEHHPDGSATQGRMDLYKRACFVLESKQFQEARAAASALERAAHDAGAAPKKKSSQPVRGTGAWDDAMLKARGQAERYVRALPAAEPNPPFLLVVDVGHSIEVFADFTQAGRNYLHFPHPRAFRIRLADLARPEIRDRLRRIWTDPLSLDPARHSAAVTCEVSNLLAQLARSLEEKHPPRVVADFLCRCLFCMFAEDVALLPAGGFTALLASAEADPAQFQPLAEQLFREMNTGTAGRISVVLRRALKRFNGGLFADATALDLDALQLASLRAAARFDWKAVEPAIFGTLLQRALDPAERHQLGAEFTPRAYVERLVLATVLEPLRAEWATVRAAAYTHAAAGRRAAALAELRAFHQSLCALRILDPACGSGNFLYVTFELLKRLEMEVLDELAQLGDRELALEIEHFTVHPRQFFGLELNPRAAALAELVLWIGYLQWQARAAGAAAIGEPVLEKLDNLQCRDAVLACDEIKEVTWPMARENPALPGLPDAVRSEIRNPQSPIRNGPVTLWDRRSFKPDPVTGRPVPDETKRVPLLAYLNPRPADWPAADFIVGNPPFLGKVKLREDLGDGYVETLRATYPEVPESADFVLYWWHKAALLVRAGQARRFGFITTNSLRQTFARRVVQYHLAGSTETAGSASAGREVLDCGSPLPLSRGRPATQKRQQTAALQDAGATAAPPPQSAIGNPQSAIPAPLSLVFAIPDHPWVDTADGAAVRIAMTVGVAGDHPGELLEVTDEQTQEDGAAKVTFDVKRGNIAADLTAGADVASVTPLKANEGLSLRGVSLIGSGFVVTRVEAAGLGLGKVSGLDQHIRPFRNGKDLTDAPRELLVIDLFGLSAEEVRSRFPATYQWVLTRVKPDRDARAGTPDGAAYARTWWLFGKPRQELRAALVGLRRFIATSMTAKHRTFTFLQTGTLPDQGLIAICMDDSFTLGVLSSHIHVVFALAAGGTLEDRPRYNNSQCFAPFPFPICDEAAKARIRALAEELDAHRKRAQARHPGLTLTGIYNVLEKLRAAAPPPNRSADIPFRPGTAEQTERGRPRPQQRTGAAEAAADEGVRAPAALLTPKEKLIHDQALVSVLKQLHDDLDRAVAAAYGWPWPLPDDEILTRLVALNAARAEEEKRGIIHWLRPEYQVQGERGKGKAATGESALDLPATPARLTARKSAFVNRKSGWPKPLSDRIRAVETALHAAAGPVSAADLAARFTRARPADVAEILETLVTLGRARLEAGRFTP